LDGDVLTVGFPRLPTVAGALPREPADNRNLIYEWRFRTMSAPAVMASFAVWPDGLKEAASLESIVTQSTLFECLTRGGHFLECPRAADATAVVSQGRVVLQVRDSSLVAAVRAGTPPRLWLLTRYATGAHAVDSTDVAVK
jgi:hypothetical protein